MSIITSNFSFDKGVQGRYLVWTVPAALESFPQDPGESWRLIKYMSLSYTKTVLSDQQMVFEMIREGLAVPAHVIWTRYFRGIEATNSITNLTALETTVDADTFMVPNASINSQPLLMPPRSQLRATNNTAFITTDITMFMLESFDVDGLKPYF